MVEQKRNKSLIIIVSVAIPLVVLVISQVKIQGVDLSFLPAIYAAINGLTAICLVLALLAIKQGKVSLHEKLTKVCILLSLSFLIMYVLYHITSQSTPFGGQGIVRYVYFFVLISHILLSIATVPLVLLTFSKALAKDFMNHKKLAKVTFPIWLYVAVSGVLVYWMISPYY